MITLHCIWLLKMSHGAMLAQWFWRVWNYHCPFLRGMSLVDAGDGPDVVVWWCARERRGAKPRSDTIFVPVMMGLVASDSIDEWMALDAIGNGLGEGNPNPRSQFHRGLPQSGSVGCLAALIVVVAVVSKRTTRCGRHGVWLEYVVHGN